MTQPAENQKWTRLPLWQELLVFAVSAIAGMFVIVAIRNALGWPVPEWVGIGLGGPLGVIALQLVARKRAQQKVKAEAPTRPQS